MDRTDEDRAAVGAGTWVSSVTGHGMPRDTSLPPADEQHQRPLGGEREPLLFSRAPCRLTVEIVPARLERLVDVDLPAGSTWDDYSQAVEKAAGVTLGPEPGQWLLSMHWDRP